MFLNLQATPRGIQEHVENNALHSHMAGDAETRTTTDATQEIYAQIVKAKIDEAGMNIIEKYRILWNIIKCNRIQ